MDNDVKVSVLSIAFNHEKYVGEAIESMINQKTNFKYEILIHDDASTDNTAKIIKEYAEKYPDLIKPILQTENQHKKGLSATRDILLPHAKGKYIALLECDDYWCDENKLQKQFDFMESHNDCLMCTHNTSMIDATTSEFIRYFNNWTSEHMLDEIDVIIKWAVHRSSFFIRKDWYKIRFFKKRFPFGDTVDLTSCLMSGEIWALPYVMSTYRANNPTGFVQSKQNSTADKNIRRKIDEYYVLYDELSKCRFSKTIAKLVMRNETVIFCDDCINLCKEKKYAEVRRKIKEFKKSEMYKRFFKHLSFVEKVKLLLRLTVISRKVAYRKHKRNNEI